MGALDTSLVFFLPFGIDALVIYLTARDGERFWLYPLLAAAGSLAGASVTFWIGRRLGEPGLARLVSAGRLKRIQRRVRRGGAVAMAVPALLPPPFPLTPFILACGALDVSLWRFFATLATARVLRFGTESLLALRYGSGILDVLQSDTFRMAIIGFIVVAGAGTAISGAVLWRKTRH